MFTISLIFDLNQRRYLSLKRTTLLHRSNLTVSFLVRRFDLVILCLGKKEEVGTSVGLHGGQSFRIDPSRTFRLHTKHLRVKMVVFRPPSKPRISIIEFMIVSRQVKMTHLLLAYQSDSLFSFYFY